MGSDKDRGRGVRGEDILKFSSFLVDFSVWVRVH